MKRAVLISGVAALALGAMAVGVFAQGNGPMRMGGHGGPQIDFQEIDANSDGKVTPEEMKAYGAAKFAAADTDGNGTLSAAELATQMKAKADSRFAKGAEKMIEWRDKNGDGQLSQEEMTPKDGGGRIFERLDADEDGAISKEEFENAKGRRGGRRMMRRGNGYGHGNGHGPRGDCDADHDHGRHGYGNNPPVESN